MKKLLALILAILMTLSLCACGSIYKNSAVNTAASQTAESYYVSDAAAPMAAMEEADFEYDGDYGFSAAAKGADAASAKSSDAPEVDPEKII